METLSILYSMLNLEKQYMMVYVFFLIFVTALDLLLIGVQPSVLESSFVKLF